MTRISSRELSATTEVVRPEGVPEGSVVTVMRVPPECAGMRLDRFVQTQLKRTSRTRTQQIIAAGCYAPDARRLHSNDRVKAEQHVLLWRAPWDEEAPDVEVPVIYEDRAPHRGEQAALFAGAPDGAVPQEHGRQDAGGGAPGRAPPPLAPDRSRDERRAPPRARRRGRPPGQGAVRGAEHGGEALHRDHLGLARARPLPLRVAARARPDEPLQGEDAGCPARRGPVLPHGVRGAGQARRPADGPALRHGPLPPGDGAPAPESASTSPIPASRWSATSSTGRTRGSSRGARTAS